MARSCDFFVLNKVVTIKIKTFLYTIGSKYGIIRIRKHPLMMFLMMQSSFVLFAFKVHMNRKFFLCRYKLSPLKYTILKFETFGVKIGDVTGVQSYAFCPEKWSSNRAAKRPKCHVM